MIVSRILHHHHSLSLRSLLSSVVESLALIARVLSLLVRRGRAHILIVLIIGILFGTSTVAQAQTANLAFSYSGKLRDKVGQGDFALGADSGLDGTFTLTLQPGSGSRTVTALTLRGAGTATWDTTGGNSYWILGVASGLDTALVNNAATAAVNVPLAEGSSLTLFASDWNNSLFAPGTVFTLTVTFADASTATATTTVGAAATGDTNYVYDRLGRLIAVITGTDTAIYQYDAVGNLLSITRQSSANVSIIDFSPRSGPVGTMVTIYGTGFSSTMSQNVVSVNGVPATIISASTTQLVVQVPSVVSTGHIMVSSPNGFVVSTRSFTVTP